MCKYVLIFNIDIVWNSMFQSQYIEKLLNVLNVSMFLNFIHFFPFFYIFGQKVRLNFNFRTNFTLLIKNRKPNMGLNVCLLCMDNFLLQSSSVITNTTGPSIFVRYNRKAL